MKLRFEREPLTTLGLAEIAAGFRRPEPRSSYGIGGTLAAPTPELIAALRGPGASAGVAVNADTSLTIAAVYACVRILAGLGAALPIEVYQRQPDGRRRAEDHPLFPILHDEPNPEMNAYQWREADWTNELLWGNAYAGIEFAPAGSVRYLWPYPSRYVAPWRDLSPRSPTFGQVLYDVTADTRGTFTLSRDEVLHVPGLGFDGLVGRSRITLFREGLGLAIATERHGANFFGTGAMPGIILEHPAKGNRETAQTIRRMWNEDHQGVDRAHSVSVLFDGMKANALEINHADLQFLETRSFQISEIARMFGVPLWMLNEHSKDTSWGSGIEQQFIAFLTVTLLPELRRREQAINSKLFSSDDRRAGFYVEHAVEGILRADSAGRAAFYKTMRDVGVYSVDDIRAKENEPLIGGDGGGERIRPSNMVPIGTPAPGAPVPAAPPAPAPPPARALDPEAFRPLLGETFARIFRRGRNDWRAAGKRGGFRVWADDLVGYARGQLDLVAVAMGERAVVESWVEIVERQLDGADPEAWDVEGRAASSAARALAGGT